MRWADKWREEIESGQYWDLLGRGFFDKKPNDLEPDLTGLHFYIDAFRELSTARPAGMDLTAIPFTAIAEYSRIYEIEDEDFFLIMRMMDDEFLKLYYARPKTKGKNGDNNANKNNKN